MSGESPQREGSSGGALTKGLRPLNLVGSMTEEEKEEKNPSIGHAAVA